MSGENKETIGIVLLNLGGPDSLQAVRPFLYNLFSDREIIKLGPPFLQKPVAWLISRLRSKKTEKMYSLIDAKSPILDITMAQAEALEKALNQELELKRQQANPPKPPLLKGGLGGFDSKLSFKVYIGMRYWHPFIKDTVHKIVEDGIKKLIVISLYPHYSRASTGSAIGEFKHVISKFQIPNFKFQIQYIEHWPDFPPYIEALAELIDEGVSEFKGSNFEILYSAHSLPESFIKEGDPYLEHIKMTIEKVNERLSVSPYNISKLKWHLAFQSKTGPVKWLEPTTEETIIKLANSKCKNLFVVPISFVSDHIETLYEIDILYKEIAEKHGINFKRCESLNMSEKFINALKELILLNAKMFKFQISSTK